MDLATTPHVATGYVIDSRLAHGAPRRSLRPGWIPRLQRQLISLNDRGPDKQEHDLITSKAVGRIVMSQIPAPITTHGSIAAKEKKNNRSFGGGSGGFICLEADDIHKTVLHHNSYYAP